MAANVTNNFLPVSNAPARNQPAATANGPAAAPAPALPSDSFQATANAPAVATATAAPVQPLTPAQAREQLVKMQAEVDTLNKEIAAVIAGLQAQPAATATTATKKSGSGTKPAPAVPAAPTPASPEAAGSYKVASGDYLWKIAREQLGDSKRWKEIYELNKDQIGDNPNLIQPGITLKMPPKDKTAAAPSVPSTPSAATPAAPAVPTAPTAPPTAKVTTPPATQAPVVDTTDVPTAPKSARNIPAADLAKLPQLFNLAPDPANVQAFVNEMDSYGTVNKGKVYGPLVEKFATTPEETAQIKHGVQQLQTAFNMLIAAGKLNASVDGAPVKSLPVSGSFFKLDAQGQPVKNAQGQPEMDTAFIGAIAEYKKQHHIHQTYKLADGSYATNEFVGPATIAQLEKDLYAINGPKGNAAPAK